MKPVDLLLSPAYAELKRYVLDHTGLSYYADRDDDLSARVAPRLTELGVTDPAAYLDLLIHNTAELDRLISELTIGETYFFRQSEHFDLLRRTIIPQILDRNKTGRLMRIWSAGCATGAEPYSIAILLQTEFAEQIAGWDVSILATDINTGFLARAREGLFGMWALRETPLDIQARCFRQEGRTFRLLPPFRQHVKFAHHNLMSESHPSDGLPFDLVICRNVLIYFSQHTIQTVASKFHRYLSPDGCLLVGHAEPNPENFAMFQTLVTPNATAYIKNGASSWERPLAAQWEAPASSLPRAHDPEAPAARPLADEAEPLALEEIRALADRGSWGLARNAADRLVSNDPLNAPAHFTLGLILEHAGDHQAARDSLRRAIYLDRGFALAHFHLGASLESAGDIESASRAFQNALRLARIKISGEALPHGDGITASQLADLAKAHLELLAK